jgi:hypothetical protein
MCFAENRNPTKAISSPWPHRNYPWKIRTPSGELVKQRVVRVDKSMCHCEYSPLHENHSNSKFAGDPRKAPTISRTLYRQCRWPTSIVLDHKSFMRRDLLTRRNAGFFKNAGFKLWEM